MRLSRRTRAFVVMAAACALVLAACGSDDDNDAKASSTTQAEGSGTTQAPVERVTFKLGTVTANGVDQSALLVGKEKGIFDDCGIDLEFQAFNSNPDVIRASTTGATDMSWAGPNGVITGFRNGEKLSIASGGFQSSAHLAWVVPSSSSIKTVKDLAGKKVGVPSPLGPADAALHYILDKEGVKADSVVVGGIQDGVAAMASGQVAATYMGDPTLSTQLKTGSIRLLMSVDDYTEYQTAVLVGPTSWVESHADVIDRFVKCADKANTYVVDHPEEAAKAFATIGGIDPSVASDVINYAISKHGYTSKISDQGMDFALTQLQAAKAVPPDYTRKDLDPLFTHLRTS